MSIRPCLENKEQIDEYPEIKVDPVKFSSSSSNAESYKNEKIIKCEENDIIFD